MGSQLSIPTGQLSDLATLGYDVSVKTLFGFNAAPQQVSLEIGYNRFGVKKELLPSNVHAQYRSWPIYAGYRYHFSNFYLES
ncbi:hypothetical protein AAFN85_31135 [Mucilaginibacter sp. CAU 1740]|uniref:hypothetical protein n=1 Tax=Mucilaginibacter sp. CAU 1740 TaxID=3140365 RepID=UPI00325B3B85